MSVLVSINCTTFNHEKYIADAIESFLMQKTNFEYEILIGEDCSTDHTRIIVEQYVKKHPQKIKMITSEKNVGARLNSQRLIEHSKGKYIADCEGDDYWIDPYKLQRQVDYMESHPDCSLCFHAAKIVKAPKWQTGLKIKPYNMDRICPIEDMITEGGFCPTASLMYRRKDVINPPDFYKTAHVGDYPMQLILGSMGKVYFMETCMAVYRIGVKGSWSSRLNKGENIRQKMIRVIDGDISILNNFNSFSEYKYKKFVDNTLLKKELEIYLLQGNKYKSIPQKYKHYLEQLSLLNKLKLLTRCRFPRFYESLSHIKISILSMIHILSK